MTNEGAFRVIDREGWARREQFELFRGFRVPYFSITADVDITVYRKQVPRGAGFTLGIVHAIAAAANAIPPFRQRFRGDDVIEFDVVHPSIIVLNDDEAFRFCAFPFSENFERFSDGADERMEEARAVSSLFDFEDRIDYLFMTSIPWISFTGMMHANRTQADDSVPRIAWGRTKQAGDRILLPLNVQVHHALVDGIHVGRFYATFEEIVNHAAEWFIPC
jgi:chloramphenicol O-acetyltransferase type A